MKGYVAEGESLELTAPGGGVVAGQGYIIGTLFVIAQSTVAAGEKFSALSKGVVKLTKDTTLVPAEGVRVFWDDAQKRVEGTATGLYPIGCAVKVGLAGDTYIYVDLDGGHLVVV